MKEIDFTEQIVKWREEQEAAMTKKQYEKIDTKELKRDDKKEKKEHEKDALKDDDSKIKKLKKFFLLKRRMIYPILILLTSNRGEKKIQRGKRYLDHYVTFQLTMLLTYVMH